MTGEPHIAIPDIESDADVTLYAQSGVMRLILHGALKDADLWARSNASMELKQHWARRAGIIRALYDKVPLPANPRDPYDDLPDEPMPEEADRIWRERAAAESARAAAKVAANAPRPKPVDVDDLLDDTEMVDGHGPMTPAMVAELEAQFAPADDIEDLLA